MGTEPPPARLGRQLRESSGSSKILVLVMSAGINPWNEIEDRGQVPLLTENASLIKEHYWVSGRPDFPETKLIRAMTQLNKFRMWHYPDKGKIFNVLRTLLIMPLRVLPTRKILNFALKRSGLVSEMPSRENRVALNFPISTFLSGLRATGNLRWALGHFSFDYLVRITSNCLVNERALIREIDSFPKNRVFAGTELAAGFISGAALVMSRDVVSSIVNHEKYLRLDVYEDLALSELVRKRDLADFHHLPRLEISSTALAESIEISTLEDAPIFRCKAELPLTRSPEKVLAIFKILANRLDWKVS